MLHPANNTVQSLVNAGIAIAIPPPGQIPRLGAGRIAVHFAAHREPAVRRLAAMILAVGYEVEVAHVSNPLLRKLTLEAVDEVRTWLRDRPDLDHDAVDRDREWWARNRNELRARAGLPPDDEEDGFSDEEARP